MRAYTFFWALALLLSLVYAASKEIPKELAYKTVEDGINAFSGDLLRKLLKDNSRKNFVSSPLSVHMLLSMVYFGAESKTASQIAKSLGVSQPRTLAHGYERILRGILADTQGKVKIANNGFVSQAFQLKQSYKDLVKKVFRANVTTLDFHQSTKAAKDINQWVSKNTGGKIKDLVKKDDIHPDQPLILINAIYFKEKWALEFEKKNTQSTPFQIKKGVTKKVPMMMTSGSFQTGQVPNHQAKFIVLPYKNRDLKMVIVLPDDIDGLSKIEADPNSVNPSHLVKLKPAGTVEVYLPRFKVESTIPLEETLQKMGMTDMFEVVADFSRLSEQAKARGLRVGSVVQKAIIDVNEEGSEAAAATKATFVTRFGGPPTFTVNRPFYFAIVYKEIPLFTGHVIDPTVRS